MKPQIFLEMRFSCAWAAALLWAIKQRLWMHKTRGHNIRLYTYNANGAKKSFTGPDNDTITYDYDEGNRLAGINIPTQGQISYDYNAANWNNPASMLLPGGSKQDYTYDPLMRLKTITAKDPGQDPLMTRDYIYSPAGNITTKVTICIIENRQARHLR